MSEHDANRALSDTAKLRMLDADKLTLALELTQRMPVFQRRMRAEEGRTLHGHLLVEPIVVETFPVYLKDGPTTSYGDFRDGQRSEHERMYQDLRTDDDA